MSGIMKGKLRLPRAKSPDIFPTPTSRDPLPPLLDPLDENYRHNVLSRLKNEEYFDEMMSRCNDMSLEKAFSPVLATMFQATRVTVWLYDDTLKTLTSESLKTKLHSDNCFFTNIISDGQPYILDKTDDPEILQQIYGSEDETHLIFPFFISSGLLIAVVQLTKKNSSTFNDQDLKNVEFITRKFLIYGNIFFGMPQNISIAANLSKISSSTSTVQNISNTLQNIFHFEDIDFWYFRSQNDEYAKFDLAKGKFVFLYRCSIGVVSYTLRTSTNINLDRVGSHQNYNANADLDPNKPILIATTSFDNCVWAVALRGRRDHQVFSLQESVTLQTLVPFIARSLAFSTGTAKTPTVPSEANDAFLTRLLDASAELMSTFSLLSLIKAIEQQSAIITGAAKARVILVNHSKSEFRSDFGADIVNYVRHDTNKGLVGQAFLSQKTIRLFNPESDSRFASELDVGDDTKVTSIMVVPVTTNSGATHCIISLINKPKGFTETDESEMASLSQPIGIALSNALLYTRALQVPNVFSKFSDGFGKDLEISEIQQMLDKAVSEAKVFTTWAACGLYFIADSGSFVLFKKSGDLPPETEDYLKMIEGEDMKIFIIDSYDQEDEIAPKKSSRSFISIKSVGTVKERPPSTLVSAKPLFSNDKMIGIIVFAALSNGSEEEKQLMMTYFSITLVPIGKRQIDQLAAMWSKRQVVRLFVSDLDVSSTIPDVLQVPFEDAISIEPKTREDTFKIVLSIFQHFGILNEFKISVQKLMMFLLEMRANCPNNGYRTWTHAVESFQFAARVLNMEELKVVSQIEKLSLLLGIIILSTKRPNLDGIDPAAADALADAHTLVIAPCCEAAITAHDNDECAFLSSSRIKPGDVWTAAFEFSSATDMARHFEIMDDFNSILEDGEFQIEDSAHRAILLNLVAMASDLHAAVWPADRLFPVRLDVADEFFTFGELLRSKGMSYSGEPGRSTLIPAQSVLGFFTYVCLPLFVGITKVISSFEPLADVLLATIGQWKYDEEQSEAVLTAPGAQNPEKSKDSMEEKDEKENDF